jgi:hypothetical protein
VPFPCPFEKFYSCRTVKVSLVAMEVCTEILQTHTEGVIKYIILNKKKLLIIIEHTLYQFCGIPKEASESPTSKEAMRLKSSKKGKETRRNQYFAFLSLQTAPSSEENRTFRLSVPRNTRVSDHTGC